MNNLDDKLLTVDMIPDGIHRAIAEAIGVENTLKLADIVGGASFYMMKKQSLLKPLRDAHILEEYNGFNLSELALKYQISERWVASLVKTIHTSNPRK